jgi:hypothetical protein
MDSLAPLVLRVLDAHSPADQVEQLEPKAMA